MNQDYTDQLNISKALIDSGRYKEAIPHLMQAHSSGHGDKALHLKIHSLLIKAGWHMRSAKVFLI